MKSESLTFRTSNKYQKIMLFDILYIAATGNYVKITTPNNEFSVAKPLSDFETKLQTKNFCRINRSHLVNMHHCTEIERNGRTGYVKIRDEKIKISSRKLSKIIKIFKNN